MLSQHRPRSSAQIASLFAIFFLLILSAWIFHDLFKARTNAVVPSDLGPNPPVISPAEYTDGEEAVKLSPRDLMSRPLSADQSHIPKLFHQSWKNSSLPENFEAWSQSCRTINSGWEHVLWTDDDNALMVEKYAPWFLETYNNLPEPIERADASRNLYMHIFGGVYADLDTECLRPYDSLFMTHDVPAVSHQQTTTDPSGHVQPNNPQRKAFLGQMHPDPNFHSGIPNAWMASTAGHPFWTLTLEYIPAHASDGKTAEFLTGPDALYDVVQGYYKEYAQESSTAASLDKHHAESVWAQIHGTSSSPSNDDLASSPPRHHLEVLPPVWVFPFNWADESVRRVCWAGQPKFDSETCKDVLRVNREGSYSISYFSHSWDGDPFYND